MRDSKQTTIVDEENDFVYNHALGILTMYSDKKKLSSWKKYIIYVIVITSFSSLFILFLHINGNVDLACNNKNPQQPYKPFIVKKDQYHQLGLRHNHKQEEWSYPTLGRPTKQTVFNYTKVEAKDYYEFEKRMDSLVRPYNDTDCQYARYGHQSGDGGYLLCSNLIQRSQALINVGIQAFDQFGCEFTTKVQIPNYQYDCTDEKGYHCKTNNGRNVPSLTCLGDKSQWTSTYSYTSLKDMIDRNDLKGKKITLKLDGEGSQWDGLRTLPLSYLEDIDQIAIEFHLYPLGTVHQNCWGDLDLVARLQEHFVSINYNENNAVCFSHRGIQRNHYFTSPGIEVTLVNKKLIKIYKPTRTYASHLLNRVSFDFIPQRCPMSD